MNIIKGKREPAEAERADGADGGTLGRRGVLGGLAALPVLAGVAAAGPALAAPAAPAHWRSGPAAAGDLLRGQERRYNAPLLTPGTRLVLPAGVKAIPVLDCYRRPRLAPAASTWPHLRAADGTTVDASVIPGRGAPTRTALVSGFTEGWYKLHPRQRTGRPRDMGRQPAARPVGLRRIRRHERSSLP